MNRSRSSSTPGGAIPCVSSCRRCSLAKCGSATVGSPDSASRSSRWIAGAVTAAPTSTTRSSCHAAVTRSAARWQASHGTPALTREPEVIAVVRNWLASAGRGSGVALGAIKNRYSRTVESSYLSFGCPHATRSSVTGSCAKQGSMRQSTTTRARASRSSTRCSVGLTFRATGACHPVAARTAPTDARCSSRRPGEWIVRATESDSAKEQHRDEPVAGVGSGASATLRGRSFQPESARIPSISRALQRAF
jgi:hypothetical protein